MEPALAIFGPLLGQCFAAVIAPDIVDRHCFQSVYNGQHVRDTHIVSAKGKPVYSGETLYSVDGDRLDFTYINSGGGVGHGAATIEPGALIYSGSMKPSPGRPAIPIKGRWTIGKSGYDVNNEGQAALHFAPAQQDVPRE